MERVLQISMECSRDFFVRSFPVDWIGACCYDFDDHLIWPWLWDLSISNGDAEVGVDDGFFHDEDESEVVEVLVERVLRAAKRYSRLQSR